ncbi:MAG: hypothetical protein N4J56_000555 [Chroococcidiopsis sp. SAG 2025]|uniref:Uncharacterized protein n=1 Tax=Scytonema millei VB511283 TaxID=1245923 RepID=A0A9X5I5H4_9CYAN|nr:MULTISPECIES: hypothetical protein [Cyanophyceae]MDV2990901.1 hypothetical protein [Chroococcidiopsis sp. SAG 2025]NHC36628.1 hypothetical protein [Scytonema millei VB511283]
MTIPNFQAMTRKELLAYMLEHRDDDEAFRVFMDKVHAEPPTEVYPAPQSIDDLKHFPQLLEKHRQQQKDNSDK